MELFKTQINRIQQQLAGLTISQKMLTGTLVAITVITLVWWARYAGTPEMEPLSSKPMSGDELVHAQNALGAYNIANKVSADGKLLVPSEERNRALGVLAYEGALPADTSDVMQEALGSLNPFDSEATSRKKWDYAVNRSLAAVFRTIPGVATAQVTMDTQSQA